MPNKSFDSAVEAQLDMFRTSAVIEKDVLRVLLRLQKELISRASAATFTEWGRRRINQQIAEVKDLVKQYYNEASAIALEGTSAISEASSKAALTSLSVGSSSPLMPSRTVLEAIASQSVVQGATQGDWWARQSTDTAFRYSQAVRQGLAGAETNQQIVARVRGFLDTSKSNAAGLVQTSVATIANDARQAVFENNQDIIKRYRAVATLDTNTCTQCFPAGTKVLSAGILENVFRANYRGEMFIITTAAGKKLKGTANHPVLTARGFLPLCELKKGDQVFNAIFDNGVMVVGDKNISVPTDIAEIFNSFHKPSIFDVSRKAAAAIDFYGDGKRMYGEVDIVSTQRHLRNNLVSRGDKLVSDVGLGSVEITGNLSRVGDLDLLSLGMGGARLPAEIAAERIKSLINGSLGAPDNPDDFKWLDAVIEQIDDPLSVPLDVYVRLASLERRHNAVLFEQGSNCGAGSPELLGDTAGGHAFSVETDHIISVVSEFVDCHVYTLQTSLGLYSAEGLIVKNCAPLDGKEWTKAGNAIGHKFPYPNYPLHFNCRCLIIPVVLDGPQGGTRASADGQVPASQTFDGWLERQSKARQNEILGKGRAKLYRDGKITLSDLVRGNGSPLTLNELRSKYS